VANQYEERSKDVVIHADAKKGDQQSVPFFRSRAKSILKYKRASRGDREPSRIPYKKTLSLFKECIVHYLRKKRRTVHLLKMSRFTFEEHHFSLPQILASHKRKRSEKTLAEQNILCQRYVQLHTSNAGDLKASCHDSFHNFLTCVMIRSKYYPAGDWLVIQLPVASD